jgi:hypothetical protein
MATTERDAKRLGITAILPTVNRSRPPLPPDGNGSRWAYDWRGRPVNLWGLRIGKSSREAMKLKT